MFFSFFDKIPMFGAKIIVILVLAVIMISVWALPNKYIYKGIDKPKLGHNLKLWVTGLMIVQIIIYMIF